MRILVLEHGDVAAYNNLNEAGLELEAIDLVEGIYEFFDEHGHRLEVVPIARDEIAVVNVGDPEPEYLASALASYLRRAGFKVSGTSLTTLVESVFQVGS
jgi:hypothetical protein